MAFVALTSLIQTIEIEFLQPTPRQRLSLHDHDRAGINSFLANLSSLLALLQKDSNGNGGALSLRDLEIQIRDFALKAEDDIEIQLSNIFMDQDGGIPPTKKMKILFPGQTNDFMCCRASDELHQTLREAAENATQLLKILTREKESCAMYLGDKEAMKSFFRNISSLQACLLQRKSTGGAAIKLLQTKIRNFALKAENDIEIHLNNFLLAKHTEHEEEVSQQLCQTLQEAAQIAAELLNIIYKEELLCTALTSFRETIDEILTKSLHDKEGIKSTLVEKLSFLQHFLREESSATTMDKDLKTKIRNFTIEAKYDILIQLRNISQAKETKSHEKASRGLHQALQEAIANATELLNILTNEKESAREMGSDALNTFMTKFYYDFLHSTPIVPFLDHRAAMMSFFEKLSSLQDYLLQKESSGSAGATINDLETEIRYFVLKVGDDVETQVKKLVQAKDDIEYQQKASQLNQTLQEAAEIAAELLMSINSKSNEVDEANETQPSNTWLKHASAANVESDGSTPRGFLKPERRMVGRHNDCRMIKDQLFCPRFGIPVIISIVGMVGIGKTTVARNVYEDPSVASNFDVRGWVSIPQHYNKSRILSQLLQSITPVKEPNVIKKGSTPHELEMQVRNCFGGKKYLIVLDNITSKQTWEQAWTDIIGCVSNGLVGSYLLLTTRHYFNLDAHMIRYMHIHNMTLLDPKESWELFCYILSIDEEHLAPKFEKIRNHVVEKCDGLPQLIVEVAKRLSKCNNIQQGWKKIEKELESLGLLDCNALSVSYNILPHHLKVCFLYFGVFPKRKKILVKMLIRLWIVEGFVKPLKHKELEDEAYEYLEELTDRSLLLVEDRSCNGKIKTCRMHSALHSFCVGEAQKGGILCAVNTQQHSGLSLNAFTNSCRWLSSYSHSFDYYVLFGTNIPRSIFFFLENPEMFIPPKLLRVLAFDTSISLQRVPVQLGGLVFLRYLSITQWFEDLDDVVSNNPNLETLVVSGNGARTIHLPSSIWKSPNLRHLELGNSYMVDPPCAYKKNLQTLSWVVRPIHCRQKVYSKFPNIKNLKIFLKDDIEPSHIGRCCSNPIILDHFDYSEGLEKLSISVSIGCNATLPEQCMYPSGLKKLKLSGTNISVRDLNVIARLPQLEVLKLENAFHGTVWKVAYGGFHQLIFLLLEAKELKQWELSQNHFRMLRHLVLRSCNCLEQIPIDFAEIYTLRSIELEGCKSSLVASAKQLQQEGRSKDVEIKILGPEYDDSQKTHTELSM
ncbi:putative late blight resistance protein homolog R1A-4 isoform X2 [Ipomoea triloba]|uniref:putative late blight resistance protein homolog R1A-4 isoform X2 n=1 Tax=Ipomoea triloba TaxID=35885 RepID=UPI00125D2F18|nr:putative late blight resistance protein homolog R1A-4 isoform X2 [Ipomoea triloba]